ncbi:MAG: type II secretion system F family protein [Planctomycetes bacterium]|nr:type II secretion system F family protein [Planctomycetota bacterium]
MLLLAQLFDSQMLVTLAIFGMFAAGAWWLLELMAAAKPKAEQRLEEIKHPTRKRRKSLTDGGKESSAVAKVLEKASPTFAKPLRPTSELEASKLKQKLSAAGFRGESATSIYLGMKLVGLIVGLVLGGGTMLIVKGMTQDALIKTGLVAGLMFYLPNGFVWFMTKRRKDNIFFALPDALDLLVVCVEAGLGLDQAMRKVTEEMKTTYRVISDEFALCNFQLQMGRSRAEVLHELGARTGVDDLRSLASILIQADKFGSSIAQALRVQSDSMRTRRRQLAEEKAAKTAVKLIFPLVLFIFPGIFVILVGPAAITMVREMFPAMQGHAPS